LEDERRRTPRYPFIATAEVILKSGQPGISARVIELSLHGCFVELGEPLEKGVQAVFKIYSEGKYFESEGVVVYTQAHLGFGVRFQNVKEHYLSILKRWLLQAAQAKFGKRV
jgi:hypothetical protein